MRIAFISYEFPPDAAYGGISTYVKQAVRMLAARGHTVEVFTSSPIRSGTADEGGILVHRVRASNHPDFPAAIGPLFAERHARVGFDVLEGPEYGADAADAIRRVPDIPLVVKLHTPSFLLSAATYAGLTFADSLRWRLLKGRVREYVVRSLRGARPIWRYTHKYSLDAEQNHALDADEIASPSQALAGIVTNAWHLDSANVSHLPYPFVPDEALLNIPVGGSHGRVLYLGRLEVRKGVLDLARAIPMVLQKHPDVRFSLIGSDDESPRLGTGMREYLSRKLRRHGSSVELLPPVSNDRLADLFATADVVVIPSIWENFANVCLESMAAARAVVASEAGGMAEMLDFGNAGRLIPPCDPHGLAGAVVELLAAPDLRQRMGLRARERLLGEYNADRICVLQEQSYRRAIERRMRAGKRAI
jgi:glycosyltransferase involved in cell wall biosynthesis